MFDLAQTTADLRLPPFPFKGLDGDTYELPNIKTLSIDLNDRILAGELLEVLVDIGTDTATMAQIKAACLGALEPFVKAWLAHAEAEPGESQASSRSTAPTAGPSKPTSRGSSTSGTRKR